MPAFGGLRQDGYEFRPSLGYTLCFKNQWTKIKWKFTAIGQICPGKEFSILKTDFKFLIKSSKFLHSSIHIGIQLHSWEGVAVLFRGLQDNLRNSSCFKGKEHLSPCINNILDIGCPEYVGWPWERLICAAEAILLRTENWELRPACRLHFQELGR